MRDETTAVVVFGSSGNVVKALLETLAASGPLPWPLRIVTRQPTTAFPNADAAVEVREGSVTDSAERLSSHLAGAHKAFVCLPQRLTSAEMMSVSQDLAVACKAAGVMHVVRIGSFGIDGQVPQGPLGDAHVAAEAALAAAGVVVTSVRPTSFFSNFLAYDLPSLRATQGFASPLGHDPGAQVNWIACEDIAAVAAAALLSDQWDGRVLEVTGPEENTLSADAMRALLEGVVQAPVTYTPLSMPDPHAQPDMYQVINYYWSWGRFRTITLSFPPTPFSPFSSCGRFSGKGASPRTTMWCGP